MQRELVTAAQSGDHEAFEALARAAAGRMYGIAGLMLRNSDRAQEAVQDALVSAWEDLPRLRDPERFDAWIYRLTVNACTDHGRRERRRAHEVRAVHVEASIRDETGAVADRDQLDRGFRTLKPEHRVVVVLHFYLGLPIPELARTLDIPLGTAKSRLHYATEALRAALEADARGGLMTRNGTTA
jgi:RNA polymerase sigma-70 factor (ECF subfamily)